MLAYLSAHVGKDGITLFDFDRADARTEDIQTTRQHSRVNGMTLSEPLAIHPELYPRMSVPQERERVGEREWERETLDDRDDC